MSKFAAIRRAVAGALFAACAATTAQGANVATANITPAPAGLPVLATAVDMASQGYVEKEFFVSGTANTFSATNTLLKSGFWKAAASSAKQPYTTRVLVRYPQDASRFNGTVIVEWLNVASGRELEAGWLYSHDFYMRAGYAYMGVTTLRAGQGSLKSANASRYATLSLPSNALSYDVYSQAVWAAKQQGATLFGGLQPTRALGLGASQAAMMLATYANTVQPLAQALDGLLIQGRANLATDLTGNLNPLLNYSQIRTDLSIPVLQLQGEFDQVTGQGILFRQPDTAMVHTWEVAGASHESISALLSAPAMPGSGLPAPTPPSCAQPYNSLHIEWVANAAWVALDRWSRGLGAPQSVAPITTLLGFVQRDGYGNARGGVRLPEIIVPRVTYGITNRAANLLNVSDDAFCLLAGSATPLSANTLARLYPSNSVYKGAYQQAAQAAVAAGVMLQEDADLALSQLP